MCYSTNQLQVLKWRGGKSTDERSRKIAKYLCESAQGEWRITNLPNIRECPIYLRFMGKYEPDKIKDCLLYTSPSPRDLSTSRMPSSA